MTTIFSEQKKRNIKEYLTLLLEMKSPNQLKISIRILLRTSPLPNLPLLVLLLKWTQIMITLPKPPKIQIITYLTLRNLIWLTINLTSHPPILPVSQIHPPLISQAHHQLLLLALNQLQTKLILIILIPATNNNYNKNKSTNDIIEIISSPNSQNNSPDVSTVCSPRTSRSNPAIIFNYSSSPEEIDTDNEEVPPNSSQLSSEINELPSEDSIEKVSRPGQFL